jgi:pyridoxamine 5'-phosphate oxidase
MNRDISNMRENYDRGFLLEGDVHQSPYVQFKTWLEEALQSNVLEANAMTLSTVDKAGRPSSRIVLLKDIDDDGFVFYTNYSSRKAKDLEVNKFAALSFLWLEVQRQVRVEGTVSKVSRERSEAYFNSRPYGSQIGALSSSQSNVIEDRKILEDRYAELYSKYEKEGKAPIPDTWGGYKLKADYFEFWQGRTSRLHDRIEYVMIDGDWKTNRLEP